MDLPYSIVEGENLTIQVFLYNNQNTSSSFNITLKKETTKINFLNNSQHREISKFITVNASSFSKINFEISAVEIGSEKLTVTAVQASDDNETMVLSKSLTIKPRGTRYEKTKASVLIDLRDDSQTSSENITAEYPLDLDLVYGGDSIIRGYTVGDLSESLMGGLQKIMLLPSGCGEQNMAKFVYNLVILEHLNVTGTSSKSHSDLSALAIENLRTAYQNQLNFLRSDGSFSSWGNSDPHGSTRITAFVVESFLKATKFITIDEKIIYRSLIFLSKKQQKGDGRFIENPNNQISPAQSSSISLTAFVLLAFKAAQESQDNKISGGKALFEIIKGGTKYITQELDKKNIAPYDTALGAYVLSKLNTQQPAIAVLRDKLNKTAHKEKSSGFMYWNALESAKNKSGQHVEGNQYSVETTGYALMAFIESGQLKDAYRDIARWLFTQINSNENQINLKSSIVGISALAKFAEAQKLQNSSTEMRFDIIQNDDEYNSEPSENDMMISAEVSKGNK